MEPLIPNSHLSQIAWLPIPVLLFSMAGLWLADLNATYDPPYLMLGLNLIFLLPPALFIAYQAGRSFLRTSNPGLLWFGCGALLWGGAGPVSGVVLSQSVNTGVTTHNILIWLAAACYVASLMPSRQHHGTVLWPHLWLAVAYTSALGIMAEVVLATLSGRLPTFFIQGEGGTPFRQLVLGSAIMMFFLTAAVLKKNSRRTSSTFQYWYALGLLLISIGLMAVMISAAVGSALSWTGRTAQYLGNIYLMVAAVASLGETRPVFLPLEVALGHARQRFEDVFDLAADGIVVHEFINETTDGHFLQANPAICALLGYTPEEMRKLAPPDIILPERRQTIPLDGEAAPPDQVVRHEKILVAKDGRRIPVEISTRHYEDSGHAMVLSMVRDISERKQAEEALTIEQDRFEKIAATVPGTIASFRLRPDGNACFPYASPAIKDLYGLSPEDVAKSAAPLWAMVHPDDRGHLDTGLAASARLLTPWGDQARIRHPTKGEIWIEGHAMPIRERDGSILWHGYLQDITQRKQVEEALHLSLAEVHGHHTQMIVLNRMNAMLLSCQTRAEAYEVITISVSALFTGCDGGLAMGDDNPPDLRIVATWGDAHHLPVTFAPHECWALRRGEPYDVADPAHSVHCRHFMTPLKSSYLCVPLTVQGETLGLLHVRAATVLAGEPFLEWRTLVLKVSGSIKLALSNLKLREALLEQATHDPLTGLLNRRCLDETLPRELSRRQRRGEPLALAMLDLDHCKRFNDDYGHEAGDTVLRAVGGLLRRSLRASDIACRYGGEELIVVLPNSALNDAQIRLEALRKAIMQLHLFYRNSELPPITVSIGVAAAQSEETDGTALLGQADTALYQAKAQGRNRVVFFNPDFRQAP